MPNSHVPLKALSEQVEIVFLKFCDDDGPNLCRVTKVDVSSTFIENIFWSGLTLVSFSILQFF